VQTVQINPYFRKVPRKKIVGNFRKTSFICTVCTQTQKHIKLIHLYGDKEKNQMSNEQEIDNTPMFLTSEEIAYITQTAHKFVLKRASEQLIKAGINPNDFWSEYTDLITGKIKKRLHLPKRECLLAINDPWYSGKAIAEVMSVWNTWALNGEI